MTKDRAVIYARFSSHNQRDESIEIQVESCEAFCAENGLTVVRAYADYAKTGRTTNRREFQNMMEDAKHGLFDYVVIYKVTRIMRNRDEMALARIMLRKAGVELLYAGETIGEGSTAVLHLGMLEVLAEYESAVDSERIRDGIQKNARHCLANGHLLYGWDIVDGRYEVNEREAALLRRMKDMLLSGQTVADITRAMANERTRNGKKFTHAGITKLLCRVQNGGTYSYAGHVEEGGMPGLWPREEQDMVMLTLGERRRPKRRVDSTVEYPLSGRLRCAACGRSMVGVSGTSKTGRTYTYYKCPKCHRAVKREETDTQVVDMVLDAVKRPDVREKIAQIMSETAAEFDEAEKQSAVIQGELAEIQRAFDRIWRAIEDGIAPPGGAERTAELKKRQEALEAELRVAQRLESLQPTRERVLAWLDGMAESLAKGYLTTDEVINTFVRRVDLDGDDLCVYFQFGDEKCEPHSKEQGSHNNTMVERRCINANSTIPLTTCTIQVTSACFIVIKALD